MSLVPAGASIAPRVEARRRASRLGAALRGGARSLWRSRVREDRCELRANMRIDLRTCPRISYGRWPMLSPEA
eukprot:2645426-Prymnesium_polylepis.1